MREIRRKKQKKDNNSAEGSSVIRPAPKAVTTRGESDISMVKGSVQVTAATSRADNKVEAGCCLLRGYLLLAESEGLVASLAA